VGEGARHEHPEVTCDNPFRCPRADSKRAFSDGVFAIAITLLVLEIPVPKVEHGGLADALLDGWPSYAAYVVSFATIGIIWVNHHAVFGYFRRVDRGLLYLNLNLLLWVALIPWPTRLLAEYMLAGGADERAAALVYSLTMTLMGISFGGMWLYITRRPEVVAVARLTPAEVSSRTRRFVIGAPLYALSIGLALVSAPACLATNAFLALYYAVPSGGSMAHITERPG
jgi:TMEM175 potassium channel family protein